MAKLVASETAVYVTDEAIQILGRQRLHPRLSRGADAPRRKDLHHLRRHQRDPAPGDFARADRPAHPLTSAARHDGRMTTEIRVLDSEDDLLFAANVFRTAMVGFPPLSNLQPGQITKMLEPGRTIGAFVGGQLVGTADATTSGLTLPGGAIVGHAAVTRIGVLPSFTRKGIATDLIRHQLHDIAARGEVVATLRASEATIYGRYGYGVASSSHTVESTRHGRRSVRMSARRAGAAPGCGTGLGHPPPHLCRESSVPAGHRRPPGGVVAGPSAAHRSVPGCFVHRGARRAR